MNLPNAITLSRIALAPLVAFLPLVERWEARLLAFVLFLVAAISDGLDGALARRRNAITELGQLLDPLADKLLLVATLVPMWHLAGSRWVMSLASPHTESLVAGSYGAMARVGAPGEEAFPFLTPWGPIGFPLWILVIVMGRELFMTVFRQLAARRGVIIAAIGPAKWKTGMQMTWIGAAYFWFFLGTLAEDYRLNGAAWRVLVHVISLIGLTTMLAAVALTLYSLWLYVRRYGRVFTTSSPV
jgi:CDP-diacylglycerol---glycerol-3-phosphate 3-phosphatidyltransferase